MTDFIGLSFGVRANKLCAIAASNGYGIADLSGITTREAFAFLWSLSYVKQKRVIVAFDSAVDFELVLRDLTKTQKDKLFGITAKRNEVWYKNEAYAGAPWPTQAVIEKRRSDRNDVTEVLGYRLSMLLGKVFRLARPKKAAFTIYDIEAFFSCGDLRETVKKYLGLDIPAIIDHKLALFQSITESELLERCFLEADYIKRLAEKVEQVIDPLNLKLRQWYGPSAIAARCLTKWKARSQAKRLHEKNSASELLKAIDCALFGGRVELIKNGTIKDIRTHDLNSAYAYAVTLLSKFYKPLRFTRRYQDNKYEPFSVWLCDFELPESVSIGVLPARSASGSISFRGRGRGYYWQPEVDYLRQRYPESFSVKWGYVGPYEQVSFAGEVEGLYQYRNELKVAGDKGESIIKLALANLYGKFSQNTGAAHFQCRAWAGWITSFVRRLLLEAVTGIEDKVICFNQDAVHLAGVEANVKTGSGLGEWKTDRYKQGTYAVPGFYDCEPYPDGKAKSARRGVNLGLDWQRIRDDLSNRQCTELERSFFVGWQLAQSNPGAYGSQYLSEVQESLTLVPANLKARNYRGVADWNTEFADSTINRHFDGTLSRRYIPQDTSNGALRLKLKDRGWI